MGTDGFAYQDDVFLSTNQPAYADGSVDLAGGFVGGGLRLDLGGLDNADILNMSGGWPRSFTLSEAATVTVSFRYLLTQASDYESDELSQMLVAIDGQLRGQSGNDFVAQVVGSGNGGTAQTTGWQLVQLNLGNLTAGQHTLAFGGFNNKKTFNNEITDALVDDLVLAISDQPDPLAGPQQAVASLSFQRFKDNIQPLAGFGDRTQGSASDDTAAEWVRAQLETVGYTVEEHAYTFGGQSRTSLFATKLGSIAADRMIIVSAHLDGRGGGGAADDDASGCSLVLECACAFSSSALEADLSVRFIFWNNEETGLNGSAAYVNDRAALQGLETPPGSGLFPRTGLGGHRPA